jgi:cell wall-associated NlpC family hydrolase
VAIVLVVHGGASHANAHTRTGAAGSAQSSAGSHGSAASSGASASSGSSASHGSAAAGGSRVAVAEHSDPEEASSFPVSGSVRHKAAATPRKASEAAVAAGALSDAEVEKELAQVKGAERSAKQQQSKPVPGGESVGGNGTIPIPTNVPEAVQRVVAGANAIADFPYVFGGGHASFVDNAYDCSGSVSYALAAGGLISSPETSGELEHYGEAGPGRYITIYANAGHTYMYVDGVLFDTAGRSGPYASRWQVAPTDNAGYVVRHPDGL